MGATSFIEHGEGKSPEEVFNALVAEATFTHGNDGYNGSINTCSMGRQKLSFDVFKESNMDKANIFIDKNDNGQKWVADYIDLGVIRYEVHTVKKNNTGNSPRYKMKFVVKQSCGFEMKNIKSFDTKKEADDYALTLAVKNSNGNYLVDKEYVIVGGKSTTTEIARTIKEYKTKPNLKPMKNRVIVPIHKYIFFGWASC